MTINSRNKGASFEREIAKMLEDELGFKFKRDLRQYQAADYGDLITDDHFPFLIECKRYASGTGARESWWSQAVRAAKRTSQFPCVIYKYDRHEVRCVVPLNAIANALDLSTNNDHRVELAFSGFCYVARELIS
tara:strand:- start:2654 stop:3055 length:402 start_codon:yes stop_codon:yes gene_type:complete